MVTQNLKRFSKLNLFITSAVSMAALLASHTSAQQTKENSNTTISDCHVDLTLPGQMSDIISNALMRGMNQPEGEVFKFLSIAKTQYPTGMELLKASAEKFDVSEEALRKAVIEFKHCNCSHGETANDTADPFAAPANVSTSTNDTNNSHPSIKVSKFALDVTTHVVLHELGHGLIREFDLPVLGNEETMADAFATHYLTAHLPDRAYDVLQARIQSLMIEAKEVPRQEWDVSGEHNSDARRAHQIASLAVAAAPAKYTPLAKLIGMSDRDIKAARDYGTEIHRSWRRTLHPLMMPAGQVSNEARMRYDQDSDIVAQLIASGMVDELKAVVEQFDWHSQVTIHFAEGDGGAGWNRSRRTVTVNSEYVRRFVHQGKTAESKLK